MQLIHCFPPDHKTDQGQPFWSGPKRCPEPIKFNPADEIHIDFVQAAANIFANIFGYPYCTDRELIKNICSKVKIEQYVPKKASIKTDDKD